MKKLFAIIFLSFLTIILSTNVHAQGCSDAGFCTMNSFKPNHSDSIKNLNNQFKVGSFYGKADNSILVYGSYVEFSKQLNNQFGFDTKLTSIAQTGNDIAALGISDLFINANYKTNKQLKFTLGAKIPFSNASKTKNNLPLPMDYQASLGTFDLIFGIGYDIKKLQIVAAIQQPLTQNNNQFLASSFPMNTAFRTFQSTNQFKRSADVLLRISYPINISSKLKFTTSLLPIYHLSNDTYIDELNVTKEIKGSEGLTLNANTFFDYEINSKNSLQFNLGVPFIVRDVRPDGLTRSFIASLEYKIRF